MNSEETLQFECPFCEKQVTPTQNGTSTKLDCPYCGKQIDIDAQEAVARARENYQWALEQTTPELLKPRKRPEQFSPQTKDALLTYQQAYTGLQVAFRAELPASQREEAIEMMAEMSHLLQLHHVISGLEAQYWTQLMVCQTAKQEHQAIEERLKQPRPGILTRIFRHPHWHLRHFQLKRALARRHLKLLEIEQDLAFVEPLHTHADLFDG